MTRPATPEMPSRKLLMVGPMPVKGQYVGGIAVLLSHILESWDLPYRLLFFNTEGALRAFTRSGRLHPANLLRFVRNGTALLRMARRERPDLVHMHTSRKLALLKDAIIARSLRRYAGTRVLGHVHWASYETLLVGRSRLLRRLQIRTILRGFDGLILMSQSIGNELARPLSARDRELLRSRARVIYNCTPMPGPSEAASPAPRPLTVFFIGVVGRRKGAFDLIAAARRLVDRGRGPFRVVLAGPCDDLAVEKEIRAVIRAEGLEEVVTMTGAVDEAGKDPLFRQADIFALPSYGEGLPMSLLEAFSYGIPAVTTSVGGIPELVVDGESGFLIEPGDIAGLAGALDKLLGSAELRERMGRRGRERIEQGHTPERYLAALSRAYEDVSAGGR